jgi:hypothetical protein
MVRQLRRFSAILALAAVLMAPAASFAGTDIDRVGEQGQSPPMVDALVLRPVGLLMLVASAGIFLPAAAITAAVRPADLDVPYDILIRGPVRYVFVDPLGSH